MTDTLDFGTRLVKGAVVPSANGRTVDTVNDHLANNAEFNPKDWKAPSDGLTAADARLAATVTAAQSAGGGVITLKAGHTYRIDNPLTLPDTVTLHIEQGAKLKAGATMAAMIQTPLGTVTKRGRVSGGGEIDCNDLADVGIYARFFGMFYVEDVWIRTPKLSFAVMGDPLASSNSYGAILSRVHGERDGSHAIVSGSQGFVLNNASDSAMNDVLAVGMETGFRIETEQNRLFGLHAWVYAASGVMTTAFDDNANGNEWHGCYGDTPSVCCFRIRKQAARIIGGKCYNNNISGSDNVIVGIKFDAAVPFATIKNVHFKGADGTRRILKDIDAADFSGLRISGSQWNNVTTLTNDRTPTSLAVGGNLSAAGATTLGVVHAGALDATSAAVSGNETVGGTLGVTGVTTLTGQLNANGGIAATGNISTPSGNLIGDTATGKNGLYVSSTAASGTRRFFMQTGAALRAAFGLDAVAEGGANAGSSVLLNLYSDAGSYLFTALEAVRSTGVVKFAQGLMVGSSGTIITQSRVFTPTLTPAATAANSTVPQTFTVTGLSTADTIAFSPPDQANACVPVCWIVSAVDTLKVWYNNPTAGSLTSSSGVCRVKADRS